METTKNPCGLVHTWITPTKDRRPKDFDRCECGKKPWKDRGEVYLHCWPAS